ncbi:MAG: HupE/UreJ family protein [Boseongicola sp.]
MVLISLLSSCLLITFARAHEVQPTVADITIGAKSVDLSLQWVLEAPVAGLDLEGLNDTNTAENSQGYDRLRGFHSEDLAQSFRDAFPAISQGMTLRTGGSVLAPAIVAIEVPDVGDIEVPRISTVQLSAPLPDGIGPVIFTWPAAFGPLVIRQQGVEDGYTAFLANGGESAPISRTGNGTQSAGTAFVEYIGVGFDHIIPKGLDHILFVLGLFFLALKLRPLLWQVTAFTLAHTVTLALGTLDIVRISPDVVEPLIAASIVYVGIENVLARGITPWRPVVVFLFGLLHGLGFASVLSDFGLGGSHFVPKLIGFNIGVEIGQLAVICAALLALGLLFGQNDWYKRRIAAPVSIGISVVASFWVLQRIGLIETAGTWALFSLLTEGGLSPVWVSILAGTLAVFVSVLILVARASEGMRDIGGAVTSFSMFLAVIATFTAGGWIFTGMAVAIWILAIWLQSQGSSEQVEA